MEIDLNALDLRTIGGGVLVLLGALLGGSSVLKKFPTLMAWIGKLLADAPVADAAGPVTSEGDLSTKLDDVATDFHNLTAKLRASEAEVKRLRAEVDKFTKAIKEAA